MLRLATTLHENDGCIEALGIEHFAGYRTWRQHSLQMQQLRPLHVHRYQGRNSCVPPRSRSSASRREPMTNRARCVPHPSPLSASGEREGPARREGWSSVWSASATVAISRFGPTLRLALLLVLMASGSVRAQESTQDHAAGARAQQSMQDLAVAAQNPIAAMYSLLRIPGEVARESGMMSPTIPI